MAHKQMGIFFNRPRYCIWDSSCSVSNAIAQSGRNNLWHPNLCHQSVVTLTVSLSWCSKAVPVQYGLILYRKMFIVFWDYKEKIFFVCVCQCVTHNIDKENVIVFTLVDHIIHICNTLRHISVHEQKYEI